MEERVRVQQELDQIKTEYANSNEDSSASQRQREALVRSYRLIFIYEFRNKNWMFYELKMKSCVK